ncbi:hypothetical protein EVAR_9572_1 [Eumeta japonica]|uniref:Uncharacterized protein n=1 Tax=Eumeta variegata TaxID=151549 RepID=A0A4C1TJE0_EUMVA|nr:hypothetical protein EVAR_9572_1 [Eumeta japonica]
MDPPQLRGVTSFVGLVSLNSITIRLTRNTTIAVFKAGVTSPHASCANFCYIRLNFGIICHQRSPQLTETIGSSIKELSSPFLKVGDALVTFMGLRVFTAGGNHLVSGE